MVDSERLESDGALKPDHLGYITCIFEDTSNSRFCLQYIRTYKEVMNFIKNICVCDMYVITPEELITYKSFLQEATYEYRNLVNSKRWEPATSTEKYQEQPSLPKAYTAEIEQSENKSFK